MHSRATSSSYPQQAALEEYAWFLTPSSRNMPSPLSCSTPFPVDYPLLARSRTCQNLILLSLATISQYLNQSPHIKELTWLWMCVVRLHSYDHCDIRTLVTLWEISNSTDTRTAPLQFFVPLGVKDTLILGGIPDELVMEMDWWESIEYQLSFATHIKIVISCTPCQHSSGAWFHSLVFVSSCHPLSRERYF